MKFIFLTSIKYYYLFADTFFLFVKKHSARFPLHFTYRFALFIVLTDILDRLILML